MDSGPSMTPLDRLRKGPPPPGQRKVIPKQPRVSSNRKKNEEALTGGRKNEASSVSIESQSKPITNHVASPSPVVPEVASAPIVSSIQNGIPKFNSQSEFDIPTKTIQQDIPSPHNTESRSIESVKDPLPPSSLPSSLRSDPLRSSVGDTSFSSQNHFVLPPSRRPMSPRDGTVLHVNGQELNREDIHPISVPSPKQEIPKVPSPRREISEARTVIEMQPVQPSVQPVGSSPRRSPTTERRSSKTPRSRPPSPRDAIPIIEETSTISMIRPASPTIEISIPSPEPSRTSSPKRPVRTMESPRTNHMSEIDKVRNDNFIKTGPMHTTHVTEPTHQRRASEPSRETLRETHREKADPPRAHSPIRSTNRRSNVPPPYQPGELPRQDRQDRQERQPPPDPQVKFDFTHYTPEQRGRERANYRLKFDIIHRTYPRYPVPTFEDHDPLEFIAGEYDEYVRRIHIDNNVDQYRVYLVVLFLGIELFGTKVLGMDFSNYTMNQMSIMSRYERLLIELGEKNQSSDGSRWPVEIRILLLALFNAVVFIIVKVLSNNLGPDIANFIQSAVTNYLSGSYSSNATASNANAPSSRPSGSGRGDTQDNIPAPPTNPFGNGINIGSLIGGIGSMMSGGQGKAAEAPQSKASRKPRYNE